MAHAICEVVPRNDGVVSTESVVGEQCFRILMNLTLAATSAAVTLAAGMTIELFRTGKADSGRTRTLLAFDTSSCPLLNLRVSHFLEHGEVTMMLVHAHREDAGVGFGTSRILKVVMSMRLTEAALDHTEDTDEAFTVTGVRADDRRVVGMVRGRVGSVAAIIFIAVRRRSRLRVRVVAQLRPIKDVTGTPSRTTIAGTFLLLMALILLFLLMTLRAVPMASDLSNLLIIITSTITSAVSTVASTITSAVSTVASTITSAISISTITSAISTINSSINSTNNSNSL